MLHLWLIPVVICGQRQRKSFLAVTAGGGGRSTYDSGRDLRAKLGAGRRPTAYGRHCKNGGAELPVGDSAAVGVDGAHGESVGSVGVAVGAAVVAFVAAVPRREHHDAAQTVSALREAKSAT